MSNLFCQEIEVLYGNHHRWLCGWLRRKLGSNCDARDFAHDTFLRIFISRDLSGIREPRAYLATVASGIVANFYRRQAIENAYLDALLSLPEQECPSPEHRAIVLETLVHIDQLLDGLSLKARHAFLMAQLEGLSQAKISRKIGVSISMVKQYMLQATRQFYFPTPA